MGEPIQIISFDNEGKLKLNEEGVEEIFNKDELQKLPIVILSAVGPFRSGKSFLLSWIIHFLSSEVNKVLLSLFLLVHTVDFIII